MNSSVEFVNLCCVTHSYYSFYHSFYHLWIRAWSLWICIVSLTYTLENTRSNMTKTLTPTLKHRYNVTAHASKTVIPLFMIWKVECVETRGRGKELYDITIYLRHDRPKDNMYKKSFFSFIMKANKNDADRRNEEFQRRLASTSPREDETCRPIRSVGGQIQMMSDGQLVTEKTNRSVLYSVRCTKLAMALTNRDVPGNLISNRSER